MKMRALLSLLALWMMVCVPTRAAEENAAAAAPAVVRGRVVDANNQVLPGATIYIADSRTGTISDVNGFYTLSDLKPGTYDLTVSYVGYSTRRLTVTVEQGVSQEVDIVLSEGVELQDVVVGSAFRGQRAAINSQKNHLGIVNMVSADQVGKFPDSNIGDALKRINGINVQYDQGEARFGQVRGTSPELSSVTINGNRIPSAEGDVRNVQLDLIPADMIQTIEVNKVVTADMDGDAIGGSINLVTKNSPYKRTLSATAGTGYNRVSQKPQLNLGLTAGDRFAGGRLGVMAALSYQMAPGGSDNTEFAYIVDDNDCVVLQDAQIRQYYVTRERQSYSLSLDYDLASAHRLTLKGIYNRRNDWENRYRLTYKDICEGDGKMQARIQTKAGSSDNKDARLERQETMDFTLGGEHQLGPLGAEWSASFARAGEKRPEERYFDLQLKKQTFDFENEGGRHPYSTTPVSVHEGKWSLKELTNSNQDIVEKEWKLRIDLSLPLARGLYGNKLKAGAKHVSKSKDRTTVCYDYADSYSDVYGDDYTNHYISRIRSGFMAGSCYKATDFVNCKYVGSLDFGSMEGERVMEESSGNYSATENVTSGYLRLDQRLGERLRLMAGLRVEATHLDYEGLNWNIDEEGNESLDPTGSAANSYVSCLPSLLFKYDAGDNLKLRASLTRTIARPKYSYLIPCVSIDRSEPRVEIEMGNPDLDPTFSTNVDLSAEYYFRSIGMATAGVFYKRITDCMVSRVAYGSYQTYADCKITRPLNAFDADLWGIELGLQRDFGFVAPALKCLGFYGNYTYTHSRVARSHVEGNDGGTLPGSPEQMANASLCFEKAGFSVRLSYNYTADFQDDEEYQDDARLRRYYDSVDYLDLNLGYTFGTAFRTTVYAEANNLLNQPLRYYQGTRDRTMQVEYYGVKANVGIKINL